MKQIKANSFFDTKLLEQAKTNPTTKYYIGVDKGVSPDDVMACCLVRVVGDEYEMLLCNTNTDEKSFDEEVENLSKYFNVVKLVEEV